MEGVRFPWCARFCRRARETAAGGGRNQPPVAKIDWFPPGSGGYRGTRRRFQSHTAAGIRRQGHAEARELAGAGEGGDGEGLEPARRRRGGCCRRPLFSLVSGIFNKVPSFTHFGLKRLLFLFGILDRKSVV